MTSWNSRCPTRTPYPLPSPTLPSTGLSSAATPGETDDDWVALTGQDVISLTKEYTVDEDDTGKEIRATVSYLDRRSTAGDPPDKHVESDDTNATEDARDVAPPRFRSGEMQTIAEGPPWPGHPARDFAHRRCHEDLGVHHRHRPRRRGTHLGASWTAPIPTCSKSSRPMNRPPLHTAALNTPATPPACAPSKPWTTRPLSPDNTFELTLTLSDGREFENGRAGPRRQGRRHLRRNHRGNQRRRTRRNHLLPRRGPRARRPNHGHPHRPRRQRNRPVLAVAAIRRPRGRPTRLDSHLRRSVFHLHPVRDRRRRLRRHQRRQGLLPARHGQLHRRRRRQQVRRGPLAGTGRHRQHPPPVPVRRDRPALRCRKHPPRHQHSATPIAAEDPENNSLTYSLRDISESSNDSEFFTIVSSTGQLRTKEPLDIESGQTPVQLLRRRSRPP